MAVLFCRWAVEDEEEQEEEEDKNTDRIIDVSGELNSVNSASISDKNDNNNDNNVSSVFNEKADGGTESCKDSKVISVDDLKVKDCLRAPGMVFKPWNDQEEEWESEDEEDLTSEAERPKFFSFNDSKELKSELLEIVEGSPDCHKSFLDEEKERVKLLAHDDETDNTESDFSVDDLVIQKIESTSPIKTEPAFSATEQAHNINLHKVRKKKTFVRKSTCPKKIDAIKSVVPRNSIGRPKKSTKKNIKRSRKAPDVVNVSPLSENRKRQPVKMPPKASAEENHKTRRPRRNMMPSSGESVLTIEKEMVVVNPTTVFDEVKIEADENDVEMCSLITDTIDVEENITQLKMEQNESFEEDSYDYVCLGDPLGDPLSTQICSFVAVKPFMWPKLDPLFHTVTEFKLPKEFAKLIKALQKPTAKIQPLVRPIPAEIKADEVEEERQEVPREEESKIRKRKAPSNELKGLLSPSAVHPSPSAAILPPRRRSHKPGELIMDQEEGIVKRKKKRKNFPTIEEKQKEESVPLSKKAVKKTKGENDKDKPDITVVKAVPPPDSGEYQVVCKTGRYQCPLCSTRWSLNQTYGRHVVSMTCQVDQEKGNLTSAPWILAGGDQEEDLAILSESVSPRNNIFVSVYPATPRKDSYVTTSHVPSLKLLCRGAMSQHSDPPSIRVKEGLEYYHALVLPDNNKEEVVFNYMCRMANMNMVTSVKEYERLCREPLKVALYLEKKIVKSRERVGHRHSQTKRWVDKYILYLSLPLHDIFLVVSQVGYRVLEFPLAEGRVGLLCLVCPAMSCKGCVNNQVTKQCVPWQPGNKPPLKVKVRTMPPKDKKEKDKSQPPKKRSIKPSSTSPPHKQPKLPPLQLHICSPCKTVFNSKPALASHREVCKGTVRE